MVPLDRLGLENQSADDSEDSQRDGLLDDLELHQVERASIHVGSYPVCRYHKEILEKRYPPRKEYDGNQRPVL